MFITNDSTMLQTVQMIGMLGEPHATHTCATLDEGMRCAQQLTQQSAGRGA